jgi:transcriptional regulator with XRE-family HTH domain
VIDVIKTTREQMGLKQSEIAVKVGLAPSTYGAYERKERPIPDDVVLAVANELKNPAIIAEYSYQRNSEFFNVPVLNNVDTYPQVVIDALIEESSEMIKALMEIKKVIKNKHSFENISEKDHNLLLDLEEQVGDLYAALKMHFISMNKFGVNVKEVEQRCNRKLVSKGYFLKNRQKKELLKEPIKNFC